MCMQVHFTVYGGGGGGVAAWRTHWVGVDLAEGCHGCGRLRVIGVFSAPSLAVVKSTVGICCVGGESSIAQAVQNLSRACESGLRRSGPCTSERLTQKTSLAFSH